MTSYAVAIPRPPRMLTAFRQAATLNRRPEAERAGAASLAPARRDRSVRVP
jgi:hypothetical protein